MNNDDLTNVRAAIQAATLAGQYNLAQEIAEQNGLPDICLSCAVAEATGAIEDAAETYVLSLCEVCMPKFPLQIKLSKRYRRRKSTPTGFGVYPRRLLAYRGV